MSNVRGPTSALTEFLREKNIYVPNANRFRRRDREQAEQPTEAEVVEAASASADAIATQALQEQEDDQAEAGPSTRGAKRKSTTDAAPAKAKQRKSKVGASMNFDEEDDDEDDDSETEEEESALTSPDDGSATTDGDKWRRINAGSMPGASRKLTTMGSLDQCPGCEKRFCITSYTVQTASGGLCHKCAPLYNAAMAAGAGTSRSNGAGPSRRTTASTSKAAATTSGKGKTVQRKKATMQKPQDKKVLPTLQSMCINIISEYIEDVEALGGIGRQSIDTLSKSICKSRRLNPQTVQLFLEPETETLSLYDCSKLDTESLQSIATFSPGITDLNLQLCGQLDNDAIDAWSKKLKKLRRLELYGPYLVRVEAWQRLFQRVGARLESFKVRESARFDITCVEAMVKHCPKLTELGLAQIGPLDGACLKALHSLEALTYLDVSDPGVSAPGVPPKSLEDDEIIELLSHVGESLEFLHIGGNAELTDRVVLEGILPHCRSLKHLNLAHCEKVSGDAIAILFDALNALGCEPLEVISLERCRGMTDEGLRAVVQHSGPKLNQLNINSCPKVTKPALKLIAGDWSGWNKRCHEEREQAYKDGIPQDEDAIDVAEVMSSAGVRGCPALEHLDIGFVRCTDDEALATLMEGDSKLQTIKVFGCQRISDFMTGTATCKVIGLERVPLIAKNVVDSW